MHLVISHRFCESNDSTHELHMSGMSRVNPSTVVNKVYSLNNYNAPRPLTGDETHLTHNTIIKQSQSKSKLPVTFCQNSIFMKYYSERGNVDD